MDDGVGKSIMWMSNLCDVDDLFGSFNAMIEEWSDHAVSDDTPLHILGSMYDLAGYKVMLWEIKLWLHLQRWAPINWPSLFQRRMARLLEHSNRLNKLNQLRRTT
jgi:hypothetical protein